MTAKRATQSKRAAPTTKRVALYLRQSLDSKGEGLAIARQNEACRTFVAHRPGWVIDEAHVYTDNNVSAYKRKVRPGFTAMLAAAERHEFDEIVGYAFDRFTRTRRDEIIVSELVTKSGVGISTVADNIDLSTVGGRMTATILGAVAAAEVERKGVRQVLANRQTAESGVRTAGRRLFGYNDDRVTLNRVEAKVVKQSFADLLAGRSCSAIARDINAAGVPTSYGKKFTHHSIRNMLTNPTYAGLRSYKGEVITGKAPWKAVVSESTWRTACKILDDPSRRTNPHSGGLRKWLLTGIAKCGVCDDGTTMIASYTDKGRRVYQCRSSKHLTRTAEKIDEFVRRGGHRLRAADNAAEAGSRPDSARSGRAAR